MGWQNNALVIGGSGFLGSYLLNSWNCLEISRNRNRKVPLEDASKQFQDFVYSIKEFIENKKPNVVVNCIALTSLEDCEAFPSKAWMINAELPFLISEICDSASLPFVHISSDAVFDGTGAPNTESSLANPLSIYGKSKYAGELAVIDSSEHNLILRTNFFGYSPNRQTLLNYFLKSFRNNEACPGYVDVLFNPIYIRDLVRAIAFLVERKRTGIVHATGLTDLSKYEFGVLVAESMYKDVKLVVPTTVSASPSQVQRSKDLRMRSSLSFLNFEFKYSVSQGIRDSIKTYGEEVR